MANAQDIFDAINNVNGHLDATNSKLDSVNGKLDSANAKLDSANGKLDAIKAATDAVRNSVDQVNATLKTGLNQIVKLLEYADLALYQNALQNDTMICDLEKISKNTCDISNEAHLQTALQTSMNKNMAALTAMYAAVHAEVAMTLEREQALKDQIEKCCPPATPDPVCKYSPCKAPRPIDPPPQVEQPNRGPS